MKRIAIIGAGLSGMTLAYQLAPVAEIVVFEKARGIGGRMSSRSTNETCWDLGVQGFSVTCPSFRRFLDPFIKAGVLEPWRGQWIVLPSQKIMLKPKELYVGVPHMNSLCHALSHSVAIQTSENVEKIRSKFSKWYIDSSGTESNDGFDWVIITAPFPQMHALLAPHYLEIPSSSAVAYDSVDTLLLTFSSQWQKDWVFAQVHSSPISSIAINSSKPSRRSCKTDLVVHSSVEWAKQVEKTDREIVKKDLLQEVQDLLGLQGSPDSVDLHHWRFARASGCVLDPIFCSTRKLAATGDWCSSSPDLEAVWKSAMHLADKIRDVL